MNQAEKDKLSKYGKVVWDFANAKTTDDILISFFKNVQSVFNFSDDFTEKALTRFPTKQMTIGALSSKEQNLFEILLNRNKILNSCNGYFFDKKYSFHIDKYDPITLMFTISEKSWGGNDPDFPVSTFKIISEKEIEAYIDNYAITDSWENDIKAKLKTVVKLCNQIEEIKSATTNRFEAIEKLAEAFPEISKLHDYVRDIQEYIKHVLSQIIEADNAYEPAGFKNILSRYNTIQKTKYFINDDHKLMAIGPFIEDYFLARNSCFSKEEIFSKQRIFDAPISYCLIEFLKNTECSGKERIAKCQRCNYFFCKAKLNDRQIFCPVCSRKNKMTPEERAVYMKGYRANPVRKRIVAKRKREAKIQHYILNTGRTRKEVERSMDDEE